MPRPRTTTKSEHFLQIYTPSLVLLADPQIVNRIRNSQMDNISRYLQSLPWWYSSSVSMNYSSAVTTLVRLADYSTKQETKGKASIKFSPMCSSEKFREEVEGEK